MLDARKQEGSTANSALNSSLHPTRTLRNYLMPNGYESALNRMLRSLSLVFFFFLSFFRTSFPLPDLQQPGVPDSVRIGVYIFSVYDLNFPANQLNLNFYVWYHYKDDSLNPIQTFELINAKSYEKTGELNEDYDTVIYSSFRCNSVLQEDWDVTRFPFDKHTIEIQIEDVDKVKSRLVFVPDIIASKLDPNMKLDGWDIGDFQLKVVDHTYETNYGDPYVPLNEYATYSRVVASFTITRSGQGLFFKLFIGLFVSVLISVLSFFITPTDLDPRFGLPVGAIFAAIASLYVINSTLPQNAALTLVDILHDISFIFIFISIMISTISLHLFKSEKIRTSQKLDWTAFFVMIITYIVLVSLFVSGVL